MHKLNSTTMENWTDPIVAHPQSSVSSSRASGTTSRIGRPTTRSEMDSVQSVSQMQNLLRPVTTRAETILAYV